MRPSKIPQSGPAAFAASGEDIIAAIAAVAAAFEAGLAGDSSDKFNGSNCPTDSKSCLFSEAKMRVDRRPLMVVEGRVKPDEPAVRAAIKRQCRIMVQAAGERCCCVGKKKWCVSAVMEQVVASAIPTYLLVF